MLQAGTFGGVIAVGVLLAATSLKIPLICPFRAATGVPCPFCGMATGTVASLRGDVGGAMLANPFSLLVIPVAVGGLLLQLRRAVARVDPRTWSKPFQMTMAGLLVGALTMSWSFQMVRYGLWG